MNSIFDETIIYKRGNCMISATLTGIRVYERGKHILTVPYQEIKKIAFFYQNSLPDKRSFDLDELIKTYLNQQEK